MAAARNRAAGQSEAEFVLFMNDNHALRADAIGSFVTAIEAGGADVLTSFVDVYDVGGARVEHGDDLCVPDRALALHARALPNARASVRLRA